MDIRRPPRSHGLRAPSMASLVALGTCLITACAGAPPESTRQRGSTDQPPRPAADTRAAQSPEAPEQTATASVVPAPVAEATATDPPGTGGSTATDPPQAEGSTAEPSPVATVANAGVVGTPEVVESSGARACCGEEECRQPCETPADCPRCRPLCAADGTEKTCVAPQREGRAECRRDADCILVDEDLPCQVCPSCPGGAPQAWSRRVWRREVRRARAECPRRRTHGARCGACRAPRARYVPDEAICVEGTCVPHGGRIVHPPEGPAELLDAI